MAGVSAERRRLTVGIADPSVRGSSGFKRDLADQLDDLNIFPTLEDGKKAILLASKTDRDLNRRRSFCDKDTETIVPPGQNEAENEKWISTDIGIGYTCRKGLKPESPNQDSFFVLAVEDQFVLYCVLDGHGPYGHDISNIARVLLLQNLLKRDFRANPKKAFEECFVETQQNIEEQKDYDASSSGSTCSMALCDMETGKLTVAHIGDSRAVLGVGTSSKEFSAEALTEDHKPNLPAEKKRIESSNPPGRVEFDGYYNYRVFARKGQYPGLNMSRAFGDVVAHKEAGLTAFPDVKTVDLQQYRKEKPSGLLLLVCTDGVWEFIENAPAVKMVIDETAKSSAADSKIVPSIAAAGKLAKSSWDEWMKDSDNEISDDITVVWTFL